MLIKIISIFPELFREWLQTSIVKRAQQHAGVQIDLVNLRDYAKSKRLQIDDEAYGGGGMVIQLEPLVNAIRANTDAHTVVYLLSPQGQLWNQKHAQQLSTTVGSSGTLILIAGRYEGVDARIDHFVDGAISIGDYVVTGGEIPAMIVSESLVRLLPGVINNQSLISESFNDGLLDYSVYTRPEIFEGFAVPSVYLSGNHKLIDEARFQSRIENTKRYRPDLYMKYMASKESLKK